MNDCHDRDAVGDVEQEMERRENHHTAQYRERMERLSDECIDEREPDPDTGRDKEAQTGPLA
jgi:hypothetical protein